MGKHKKRKASAPPSTSEAVPAVASAPVTSPPIGDVDFVLPEEVETAVDVLNFLARRPELFSTPPFKALRTALHPFVLRQLQRYEPIDYATRVTTALRAGRWSDALPALAGLRDTGQTAKQGTIQRWVRDCDAAEDEPTRLHLLDAVLRAAYPTSAKPTGGDAAEEAAAHDPATVQGRPPPLRVCPIWTPVVIAGSTGGGGGGDDDGGVAVHASMPPSLASTLDAVTPRVVLHERGPERQPPAHHDRRVFACQPGVIRFDERRTSRDVTRHDVPSVPGAFLLSGVLTTTECDQLLCLLETLGYTPDHPVGKPRPSGIGACEWAVDESILAPLYARTRPHLEQVVEAAPHSWDIVGLNGSWRCFQYTDAEGAVYRPHVDGSWPGAGSRRSGPNPQVGKGPAAHLRGLR